MQALALLVTCLLGVCALAHDAGLAAPDVTADDGARVVRLSHVAPRIVDLTIASPAMGREAVVRLILPRSFDRRPTARWPVLYLLHGCCADYQSWTLNTDVARLSALGEVLVVMPEAGKAGFYSDWPPGPPGRPTT